MEKFITFFPNFFVIIKIICYNSLNTQVRQGVKMSVEYATQEQILEAEVVEVGDRDVVKIGNQFPFFKHDLNLQEQRLIFLVIAQIKMEDEDFKDYKVALKDIEEKTGALQNRRETNRFARTLMSKTFTIEEEAGDRTLSWFSSILRLRNESALLVRFDPALKPYLLQLKENFTKALLSVLFKFKHKYTMQVYLLLKSRINRKIEIKVDKLADILNVPKSYKRNFGDFWRYVINPALQEINKVSDLEIVEVKKINMRHSKKIEKILIQAKTKKSEQDRKENKKLVEQNKYAELEAKLNQQYKNKTIKGEDGLNWYVKSIKVVNDKEVEIEITNLSDTQTLMKKIDELPIFFDQSQEADML